MYAPNSRRILSVCDGPAEGGSCPRVAPGEEVYCWGLDLVLSADEPARWPDDDGRMRMHAAPGTTVCPLARALKPREYFSPFAPQ